MRTFYNTIAPEITVLSKQEIVDMISNTFKTEVVSDEDNFVTLKSEWIFLKDTEENVPSVESRGPRQIFFYVYLPTDKYDQFAIIIRNGRRFQNTEKFKNDFKQHLKSLNQNIEIEETS